MYLLALCRHLHPPVVEGWGRTPNKGALPYISSFCGTRTTCTIFPVGTREPFFSVRKRWRPAAGGEFEGWQG